MSYDNYYKERLEAGLKYQDFVADKLLHHLAIPLVGYGSKQYQFNVGENAQGFEIKYDDKFKETGNLYIETAEKSNPNNPEYVKSGIYRDDNSWLYVIGDYTKIFILSIEYLRIQHQQVNKYGEKQYREITTDTSRGFLLDKEGQRYALKVLEFAEDC